MRIKQGFTLRSIGGEQIVVGEGLQQVNFNKLIVLNTSAAYLWKEVQKLDFDEKVLAGLLVDQYDISNEQALADASEVADQWVNAGIAER